MNEIIATVCACCGRRLVDAESVETGIGPECRKRFGSDRVPDSVRRAANTLIKTLAQKGVSRATCRSVCAKLQSLGFTVLVGRILKRFRTTLPIVPKMSAEELAEARETYRKILIDFAYDNVDAHELTRRVRASGAVTPSECIAALESLRCPCRRCAGTGSFVTGVTNGKPMGPGGPCYRCEGRGYQTLADARRNRAFDAWNVNRSAS